MGSLYFNLEYRETPQNTLHFTQIQKASAIPNMTIASGVKVLTWLKIKDTHQFWLVATISFATLALLVGDVADLIG